MKYQKIPKEKLEFLEGYSRECVIYCINISAPEHEFKNLEKKLKQEYWFSRRIELNEKKEKSSRDYIVATKLNHPMQNGVKKPFENLAEDVEITIYRLANRDPLYYSCLPVR